MVRPIPSQSSLILEVLKRSGAGALVAVAFGYALVRVYEDLGKRNDVLVELVRQNVSESRAVTEALLSISNRVDRQTEIIDRALRDKVKSP